MPRFLLTFGLLAMLAPGTQAQTVQSFFDVRFGGLRVAQLILAVNDTGESYALAGRAESTGLVAVFRGFRFDVQSTGAWTDGALAPLSYLEDVDTGRRASTVAMRWRDGSPMIDARNPDGPPQPWDIEPAAQTGTTDPLSALYAVARPRDEDALCGWRLSIFDGRRRSEIVLDPPTSNSNERRCSGSYTRVAGFSPDEMEERTRFPFTAIFTQRDGGQWALMAVDLQSLYGPVRIVRTEN